MHRFDSFDTPQSISGRHLFPMMIPSGHRMMKHSLMDMRETPVCAPCWDLLPDIQRRAIESVLNLQPRAVYIPLRIAPPAAFTLPQFFQNDNLDRKRVAFGSEGTSGISVTLAQLVIHKNGSQRQTAGVHATTGFIMQGRNDALLFLPPSTGGFEDASARKIRKVKGSSVIVGWERGIRFVSSDAVYQAGQYGVNTTTQRTQREGQVMMQCVKPPHCPVLHRFSSSIIYGTCDMADADSKY
ncbi:hypothetical protein EDD15DRAFT_2202302 [Pisolithus albus]|nr:hypothetical protein EDD15DRAFT_2202302 [Pisolithus albus]